VFLHPFPLDSRAWASQVALLTPEHRVVTVDFPGFGTSGAPPAGLTLGSFAAGLVELLRGIGINQATVAGLSMGGYGAWELARLHPRRWAAVAIAAGGIFWSYEPERWQQASTLPAEYAHAVGRLPLWLFQGAYDIMVIPRQSELMYGALQASGGRVRLWVYQGVKHDCWTRAYNEPELPRWFLSHHAKTRTEPELPPYAERLTIPLHPPAIKLADAVLDALTGEYRDSNGHTVATIFRQGEDLYEKNPQSEISELAAETPAVFFYPNGSSLTRLTFERDAGGRVISALFRDDRHEERWERRATPTIY